MTRKTVGVAAIALISMALAVPAAQAADPAALVLDYSGGAATPLQSYDEVAAGTIVELPAGATLTLLHYRTCRTLTATGGVVRINTADVQVKGGTLRQDGAEQCPQEAKIRVAGIGGGVLMRSVPEWPATLPVSLACSLVGRNSGLVESLTVMDGDAKVVQAAIAKHQVSLPKAAPALQPGHDYTLQIKVAGVETPETVLITTAQQPDGKSCLIRVD